MGHRRERRWLGVAGLLPFAACVVLLGIADDPQWQDSAVLTMQNYAAVIAAFLGAVHWGIAAAQTDGRGAARLRWGITPALVAWALLMLPAAVSLIGFAVLFALILIVDLRILPALDDDYRALRQPLSLAVIATLVVAAFLAPETTSSRLGS
jgi:hypothetical protein